jgi:hypothetical protein
MMMVAIVALFILSEFFRGFDLQVLESFKLPAPNWLENIHKMLGLS